MTSISQLNRRNEKKRTRDFIKRVDEFLMTGRKIILKNPPNQDMVNYAASKGINAYDLCTKTLSPEEQERRRLEYNTNGRERNERDAIKNRGVYKGTGEQIKSRTQEQEEYFAMSKEDQLAAHKIVQDRRDVLNGFLCLSCKGIIPFNNITELANDEQGDYIIKKKKDINGRDANFTLHADCYAEYLLKRYRTVHQVNTTAELIKNYKNWGKKVIDK